MYFDHGGQLNAASKHFGIAPDQWIDLSTGISPWSWPVPKLPPSVWRRLPESDRRLEQAAAAYYGCQEEAISAVPGSQFAIGLLPQLFTKSRVAIPRWGYQEHRQAWLLHDHTTVDYSSFEELERLVEQGIVRFAIVINPNNPGTELWCQDRLLQLANRLRQREGLLIVDEAFVDAVEEQSLVSACPHSGLVVLRSFGKFFGLAGIRLGFICADARLISMTETNAHPWMVSTVAREVGEQALLDIKWQQQQRKRLWQMEQRWLPCLNELLPEFQWSSSVLFATGRGSALLCQTRYEQLAQNGILIRLFTQQEGLDGIRIGLPTELQFERFVDRVSGLQSFQNIRHATIN